MQSDQQQLFEDYLSERPQVLIDLIRTEADPIAHQHAVTQRELHEAEFKAYGAVLLVASVPIVCLVGAWVVIAIMKAHQLWTLPY